MRAVPLLIALVSLGCGASRVPLPPPASSMSEVPALPRPEASDTTPPRPQLPSITTMELPSGLTVQIAERPGMPVVYAALVGRGAFSLSDGSPSALDALVERALGAGLPRNLGDLSEDEDLARARISERGLVMVSRVVPDDLDSVISRYTSVLEGHGLDEGDIERARTAIVEHARFAEGERERRDYPSSSEELFTRLYGEDDGRVRRARIRSSTAERLDAARVRRRLACFVRPSETLLVIVGDVQTSAIEASVRERLGSITVPTAPCGAPQRAAAPSFPEPERRLQIFGTGDDPNAVIRLIERGPPHDHEDYAPYRVFATLAGGMFSSRLNLLLRESRGDAYGVVTRVYDRVDHSLLEISVMVPVSSAGDTATAIVDELSRLRDASSIEESELSLARTVELARRAAAIETPSGLGSALVRAYLAGDPPSSILEEYARVEAMTAADIAAAGSRWIRPEKAPMVIVGDYRWLISHPVRVPGGVGFINL